MPAANLTLRRIFRSAAAAATLAAAPLANAQQTHDLDARIESLWTTAKLTGAKAAISIVDLQSGRTLADMRSAEPMIPASNQKLITSGAALLVLGPDFVYKTELLIDGDRLIVRGGGDPALADSVILDQMPGKMSVDALLDTMVGAVGKAGIARISEVIVDDRIFDREMVHPTWPKDQLDRWYCAPITGLNFHTNVLSVFPSPSSGGVGRPASILLEPAAPWLDIENKARTAEAGRNSIRVVRDPSAQRFSIQGEIGISRVRVEVSVHDPSLFAGQLIAAGLPGAGVGIGPVPAFAQGQKALSRDQQLDAVRAVRLAQPGESLTGRVIAVVTTHLEEVLARCNTDSYNLYGEAMLKRMGREVTGEPGSFTNGASVVRMTLSERLGPDAASSTVVVDGSGMSRENRVSARTMTRWLDVLQKDAKAGAAFVTSLATPESRDSMRRRFRDVRLTTQLAAKTGTIDGVRCLSGYLTDPVTNRRLAFAIMLNDLREGAQTPQALQFHEAVVAAADEWLAAQRPVKPKAAAPARPSVSPGSARERAGSRR